VSRSRDQVLQRGRQERDPHDAVRPEVAEVIGRELIDDLGRRWAALSTTDVPTTDVHP
jgi:hypothetical protein